MKLTVPLFLVFLSALPGKIYSAPLEPVLIVEMLGALDHLPAHFDVTADYSALWESTKHGTNVGKDYLRKWSLASGTNTYTESFTVGGVFNSRSGYTLQDWHIWQNEQILYKHLWYISCGFGCLENRVLNATDFTNSPVPLTNWGYSTGLRDWASLYLYGLIDNQQLMFRVVKSPGTINDMLINKLDSTRISTSSVPFSFRQTEIVGYNQPNDQILLDQLFLSGVYKAGIENQSLELPNTISHKAFNFDWDNPAFISTQGKLIEITSWSPFQVTESANSCGNNFVPLYFNSISHILGLILTSISDQGPLFGFCDFTDPLNPIQTSYNQTVPYLGRSFVDSKYQYLPPKIIVRERTNTYDDTSDWYAVLIGYQAGSTAGNYDVVVFDIDDSHGALNEQPIIIGPVHVSWREGEQKSENYRINDADGTIAETYAIGLPAGANFQFDAAEGIGALSWRPTFDLGDDIFEIMIVAVDDKGADTELLVALEVADYPGRHQILDVVDDIFDLPLDVFTGNMRRQQEQSLGWFSRHLHEAEEYLVNGDWISAIGVLEELARKTDNGLLNSPNDDKIKPGAEQEMLLNAIISVIENIANTNGLHREFTSETQAAVVYSSDEVLIDPETLGETTGRAIGTFGLGLAGDYSLALLVGGAPPGWALFGVSIITNYISAVADTGDPMRLVPVTWGEDLGQCVTAPYEMVAPLVYLDFQYSGADPIHYTEALTASTYWGFGNDYQFRDLLTLRELTEELDANKSYLIIPTQDAVFRIDTSKPTVLRVDTFRAPLDPASRQAEICANQ